MKKAACFLGLFLFLLACGEDDINVFEKTADERAAEAIASLKQDLVAPADGWKIRYKPEEGSGSFYVLLDFNEDNKVIIRSDLGAEDGEYFVDTISYRIDNSLGLELILENYSFFSFLFEQDQATFGAEYEFNYVNKTPDNALVFQSKSDISTKSTIVFEQASADDVNLLGVTLAANLNLMSADLDKFTSSLKLTFQDRNLALYISLDELRRTLTITSASLKTNTQSVQSLNFSTAYIIEGDDIVFEEPLQTTVLGTPIDLSRLTLTTISEGTLSVCPDPITVHSYSGVTSQGDDVILETSLLDVNGSSFAGLSDFYFSPLAYIFNNGISMVNQIPQDVAGALEMHMYYGYDIGADTPLYGIGFVIQNLDGTYTFALREFTPVLNDNNLVFNFEPEISLYGNPQTDANIDNVNLYLDALAQGDKTYVFQLSEDIYEFHNPCSGWSFVFINANR